MFRLSLPNNDLSLISDILMRVCVCVRLDPLLFMGSEVRWCRKRQHHLVKWTLHRLILKDQKIIYGPKSDPQRGQRQKGEENFSDLRQRLDKWENSGIWLREKGKGLEP